MTTSLAVAKEISLDRCSEVGGIFTLKVQQRKPLKTFFVVKHELTFIAKVSGMNSAQHCGTLWDNTLGMLFYALSGNLVALATMLM